MTERENLVAALRATGLTAGDIAERIGRSQVSVWRWLAGQTLPDVDSIAAIVRAFPELSHDAVNVVLRRREPVA